MVIYTEVAGTAKYLTTHHISTSVIVRQLTKEYIHQLMVDTPLEQWYEEYTRNPIIGWHERRLHLSNAIRLAILYHKG